MKVVKSAQRLGFSLDEISGLLRLDDGFHCHESRAVAEDKLEVVRAKISDLRRIETALVKLIGECRANGGTVSCPLISALQVEVATVE